MGQTEAQVSAVLIVLNRHDRASGIRVREELAHAELAVL